MTTIAILLVLAGSAAGAESQAVSFASPGFAPTQMDNAGRLMEDWGTFGVRLAGEGITDGTVSVESLRLRDVIPAARCTSDRGAVRMVCTAFRAPIFPAGADAFTVRLEEAKGNAAKLTLAVDLPENSQLGMRTVKLGGRTVLALPRDAVSNRGLREWGYCDEASPLPGWGKPVGPCDPAFRNIRAGMGGVPIAYRFNVKPKSRAQVVLGFCESHWADPGQRPLTCRVEGAPSQTVDPVGKWGQHKPGVLRFAASDEDGDGALDISVRPAAGAADRNPILNAIWIFPPGETPDLARVIAGELSAGAIRYVDVGGPGDQSLFPPGKLEYNLELAAGGALELVFLAACKGGDVPTPEAGVWTPETLLKAAHDVWRDWPSDRKP
jgi:hypothetical protein